MKKTGKAATQKVLSISEAAELSGVTRQAVYVAIKLKKLNAQKEAGRWTISLENLQEYRRNRYSRSKSMFGDDLLFNHKEGYYSVNQIANLLRVPTQKIYYATRTGQLKAHRKGAAWVIHIDDVEEYRRNFIRRKKTRKQRKAS